MVRIPYSEDQKRQQDMVRTMAENEATVMLLLLDKGLVTQQEIATAQLSAKHVVEQQFQSVKDEIEGKWLKENPELAAALEVLNKTNV